jgi:L-threonylcarbamoyladenylate synthase
LTDRPVILRPTDAFNEAKKAFESGGVIAFPTETFYGLGVDVFNEQAIKRLYDLKRRDYGNPVAAIVADRSMLASIVREIPGKALVLMDLFWPGPLTILFPTNDKIPKSLTTNTGKIGIRISSHPVAMAMVQVLGRPLTTTSANLSGFPPSLKPGHLKGYFQDRLDLIVDCGELQESEGSTVIDVSEEVLTIIREGVIKEEALAPYFEEGSYERAQV